ncbi:MAG: DUF488 domain-containing protein [Planctomycetota bacterium]
MAESKQLTFWTVGHSAADLDDLFRLLAGQRIDVLADVRSSPYSQHVPQANRDVLEAAAPRFGVEYVFLGGELGGRPADDSLLLADGKPDYEAMAATRAFQRGLEELRRLAATRRVCCLCSEEDPARCHRSMLVAEALVRGGDAVLHLRHDGRVETQAEVTRRRTGGQLSLF